MKDKVINLIMVLSLVSIPTIITSTLVMADGLVVNPDFTYEETRSVVTNGTISEVKARIASLVANNASITETRRRSISDYDSVLSDNQKEIDELESKFGSYITEYDAQQLNQENP